MTRGWITICVLLLATVTTCGCHRKHEPPAPTTHASPAQSTGPTNSTRAKPWYLGHWTGNVQLKSVRPSLSRAKGAPSAWLPSSDAGLSGTLSIDVDVDDKGQATGHAEGTLGKFQLRGRTDGNDLRLTLDADSNSPQAMQNAFVVLSHEKDALKGDLKAATGDALSLGAGAVVLTHTDPKQ